MDVRNDYLGPIRSILLATDGSAFSEGAVKEAIYLARACGSRLSAIYVLEVNPEFATEGLQFVEKMETDARRHLDAVRAAAATANVECEVVVRRTDEAYKAVVEEAAGRECDVIVMGRRGKTGLQKLIMGSVTAKVIGYAPCSVLVVPKDAVIDCRNILLGIDGSKYSDTAAAKAIEIAKRCKSRLVVLAVVPAETLANLDPDTGYNRQQQELIAKEMRGAAGRNVQLVTSRAGAEGVATEEVILGGRPYEALIETARQKKSELIIVGSHGRTGIRKLIMGSVAERVVALSPAAVLVVKKKED